MTRYATLFGRKILVPKDLAPILKSLKLPVDEAKRRKVADTDGTRRRAQETKARHRLI
jgi:hypothetical protein